MSKFEELGLKVNISFTTTINASMRKYFSNYYLWASIASCEQLHQIEKDHQGESLDNELNYEYYSNATNGVINCLTFIESLINETFFKVSKYPENSDETNKEILKCIGEDKQKLIKDKWEENDKGDLPETERLKVLEKYQLFLKLCNEKEFDKGITPYQEIYAIQNLRNAIIHYKVESVPSDPSKYPEKVKTIHNQIRKKNIMTNPFTGEGNPFFPDKCLSYEYTKWYIESCLKFADEFFYRIGMTAPYESLREMIQKL